MRKRTLNMIVRQSLILAASLPILLLGLYVYITQTRTYVEGLHTDIDNVLQITDTAIGDLNDSTRSILGTFAAQAAAAYLSESDGNSGEVLGTIENYYVNFPTIESIYLGLEDGQMLSRNLSKLPAGYDPRLRPWYLKAKDGAGSIVITAPYENAAKPGSWCITYAMAVKDTETGVLTA